MNKTSFKKILFLLLPLSIFMSVGCDSSKKKSSSTTTAPIETPANLNCASPDFYLFGSSKPSTKFQASYWKSSSSLTKTDLSDGSTNARSDSGVVYQGTAYSVGVDNNRAKATLWYNNGSSNIAVTLNNGAASEAKGIILSGSTMYIAGSVYTGTLNVAKLWKYTAGGTPVEYSISDGSFDAQANTLVILSGSIYLGGYQKNSSGKMVATIWKFNGSTGAATALSSGSQDAVVYNLHTSGSSIYAAGNEFKEVALDPNDPNTISLIRNAKLWMFTDSANSAVFLPNSTNEVEASYGLAVGVTGSTVYVSGYQNDTASGNKVAKLWIYSGNPSSVTQVNLSDATNIAQANTMTMFNSEPYIFGLDGAKIMQWKYNGSTSVPTEITDGTVANLNVNSSIAYCP
jgi:hypothetical protein